MYAIVGWVLIQVADASFANLNLPDWTITLIIVLVIGGFPLAVILAWAYDITPDRGPQEPAEPAPQDQPSIPSPPDSSIAVLAFSDMSPDSDQDYFCDGIAEEIINSLVQVEELHVTSRTSSFQYKGKSTDIRTIGQELGVANVLEGSVRKAGEQLRVTVQLIDVKSDHHLWSERYDRPIKDIFEIQDDIALKVVDALKVQLTQGAKEAIEKPMTVNVTAYDYYLRGKKYLRGFTADDFRFARDMFAKATEADTDFALAFASSAFANMFLYLYSDRDPNNLDQAFELSGKALELDPNLADAHCARGLALSELGRGGEAREEFEAALELDPECYEAFHYYGRHSFAHQEYERAAELLQRASELEPSNYHPLSDIVMVYSRLGRQEEEKASMKRVDELLTKHIELHPDDLRSRSIWSANQVELGAFDKATRNADQVMKLDPSDPSTLYNIACTYAVAGKKEKALDVLAKAVGVGFSDPDWLTSDPQLDPIRDDERFKSLLSSM